jgi:tetraacyldisaccharide 4'-kinase
VAGHVTPAWARPLAAAGECAWELRRRAYARGWWSVERVPSRVVSVGNLTVGGTGKTTLTLHLARVAQARGADVAVVCRRYRPGPGGAGDEELVYRAALGDGRVHAGRSKRALALEAARAGRRLVLVDDGFSHWRLGRDVDIVLLDSHDPWGGRAMLPGGRLREPIRALQRADAVVLTRLAPGEDPAPWLEEARRAAPAARLAAGRHAVRGLRDLAGNPRAIAGRVLVSTATGNPAAVARTAREAGLEVAGLEAFRDHHWFRDTEAHRLVDHARRQGAAVLLTAKDAVRWPASAPREGVVVLDVAWEWVSGGATVEALVFGGGS